MPRVVHFEIHADQTARAVDFYETVFGWTFRKWDTSTEYWHITTGPPDEAGINGGLIRRGQSVSSESVTAYVCTVKVENLEGVLNLVREAGGRVVTGSFPIPGIGWMAYCKDTEGNHFGIIQPLASAGEVS